MLSPLGYRFAGFATRITGRNGAWPCTNTTFRALSGNNHPMELQLDEDNLSHRLLALAPRMAEALNHQGYFTTTDILDKNMIHRMREQSIALRNEGRFEPSWSEKIVNGQSVRFDKEGVFACEPDGQDYYTAPDLLTYMVTLLKVLPPALNDQTPTKEVELSNAEFNAKLAVTSPGGSVYPLHIDNPEGLVAGDTRKLTCILYLNPAYREGVDGGELQLILDKEETLDLTPEGGRLVAFWSDEIPHQVLPTAVDADKNDAAHDRYALTIWIPTSNATALHNPASKFRPLSEIAFP